MSIRYSRNRCPWMVVFSLATFLIGCLILGGCEKEVKPRYGDLDLSGVNLSPEMAEPLAAAMKRLQREDSPDHSGVQLMAQYQYINQAIREVNPTAVVDSFFQLWTADPENILLIDLATLNYFDLNADPRLEQILAFPALNDTNSAVGCFRLGRQKTSNKYQKQLLFKSHDLRHELDPLQQIWVEKRLSIQDQKNLRPDNGVRRLLPHLEAARRLGGVRLEFELWISITNCLIWGDHLDDALFTAALMGALANESDNPILQTNAEYWLGRVFSARENLALAAEHFQSAVELAQKNRLNWLWGISLSRAAKVHDSLGNYPACLKLFEANLAMAEATEDSLNIPRVFINIADTYRKMGQLESCQAYQDRAIRYVESHPLQENVAQLPFFLAEYSAHVGQYDRVDSLLNVALDNPDNSDIAEATIRLHIQLIKGALEQGRPDLMHQSVIQVDSLYNAALATGGNVKIRGEDDLLIAEFYTHQGEFARASFHLDRAATTLAGSDSPYARWELLRSQGLLARQRGDLKTASELFASGHEAINNLNNPDLQARSRFLLGSALLDNGQPLQARELFPADEGDQQFGGRFRTRLASQLFRGMTFARANDQEEAVRQFQIALGLCSPWSPADLVARTHLELGQALVALNKTPEASRHLHQAWDILAYLDTNRGQNTLLTGVFHGDLRRHAVETLISLYLARPETAPTPHPAQASLNLWGQLLRSRHDSGFSASPPNWESGQLVYFIGNKSSYRWDVDSEGISVQILPAADKLEELMSPVLSDFQRAGRSISTVPANRLSGVLLADTENTWPRNGTLQLVCDGKLGSLPWAALPQPSSFGDEAGQPLLQRGALVHRLIPLEATGQSTGQTPSSPGRKLLAVGANTSDGTDLADLNHAEDEAEAIGERWTKGNTTTLLGKKATWKAMKELDLASYSAIHLASHARIYPSLPNQSYLVLSKSRGQEQLTASAVVKLGLNADLVYLSSCETAAAAGGSVVGGFVRAFIQAGAKSIIASSLGVDDEASLFLAEQVYTHWQEGLPLPQALRLGQMDLRDSDPRWSHPFYWAFFRIYQ
jgi:tetratricopeptide (TPR) repeat protein